MRIITTYGYANLTGFKIRYKSKNRRIEVQSSGFQEEKLFKTDTTDDHGKARLIFLLLSLFLLTGHILLTHKIDAFRYLLAAILLIIFNLFLSVCLDMFLDKQEGKWHACEHKVGNLLDKGLDLTLENLKKMSRLHPFCGSQFLSLLMFALIGEYLLLVLTRMNVSLSLLLVVIVALLCVAWLKSERELIMLPIQYLITKEPTEEQLQEALRVAKEFKLKFEASESKH